MREKRERERERERERNADNHCLRLSTTKPDTVYPLSATECKYRYTSL